MSKRGCCSCRAVAVAVLLVAGAGCSRIDLADEAFVDGLRLLGAQAEPPEAAPGDPVTLHAWAVDPRGGDIEVSWSACLLPSNGTANDACVTGNKGLVPLGSGLNLDITVPAVDRANFGPPDASDGVYLPIVMHVRNRGDSIDAVYRLRIAGSAERNRNPTLVSIMGLLDDMPTAVEAGQTWAMVAVYSGDSREKYDIASTHTHTTELLATKWFASGGTYPNQSPGGDAVQSLKIDRALPPKGGTIDVWVVGHDERGGTTLIHRALVMQ